jgi:heat shock protein HslJ
MRALAAVTLALALSALALSACGWDDAIDSRSATAGVPSTRVDIEAHEWKLDRSDSSLDVEDGNPVTLTVREDVVSGAAPCNTYRAAFDLGDYDAVQISDVALTRRSCERSTMRAEDELIAALETVDHVSIDHDDDHMTLTAGDDLRLAFRS